MGVTRTDTRWDCIWYQFIPVSILMGVYIDINNILWAMTSLSKHFITIVVKAIGRLSFKHVTAELLGTGMIIDVLKHTDTTAWESVLLKISVHTSEFMSTIPQNPSWEVVWACCFPNVYFQQWPPYLVSWNTERLPSKGVSLELGEEFEISKPA